MVYKIRIKPLWLLCREEKNECLFDNGIEEGKEQGRQYSTEKDRGGHNSSYCTVHVRVHRTMSCVHVTICASKRKRRRNTETLLLCKQNNNSVRFLRVFSIDCITVHMGINWGHKLLWNVTGTHARVVRCSLLVILSVSRSHPRVGLFCFLIRRSALYSTPLASQLCTYAALLITMCVVRTHIYMKCV